MTDFKQTSGQGVVYKLIIKFAYELKRKQSLFTNCSFMQHNISGSVLGI